MTKETFKQLIESPAEGKKEFLDKVCNSEVSKNCLTIP